MEQEMRYIYEIWREGSFSRAAEKLYLSQSALSMAVSRAERQLGAPIFDRSHRPPLLTPAGQVYLDTARQAMQLEEDMERRISDIRRLHAGRLCIGGSHYLNAYILPDILCGFHRRYPDVKLELVESSSAELAKMLARRELDLTFSCNEAFLSDFPRYPAFSDHVLLGVPRQGLPPQAEGLGLTAAQVAEGAHLRPDCPTAPLRCFQELGFLLLSPGNNLHDRAEQLFREAGFQPKVLMELSQLVTACRLAEHGLGASFISDRIVTPDSRLVYFKLDSRQTERAFYMLLPKRSYTPHAVRAFIDHVRETLI